MTVALPSPLGLTCAQYVEAWARAGRRGGAAGAQARYADFFRRGVLDAGAPAAGVPPVTREVRSESPEGTVVKFCQSAGPAGAGQRAPALEVESVLIPMIGKKRVRSYTLCVSSQVGCAMGCDFCQTAQMGLRRSLDAGAIVGQWFAARHLVERPDPAAAITNIVFMGMGEPMDNLDAVVQAIAVLTDRRGPSLASGRITVSTVGHVPGIARLADLVRRPGFHRLGLAVSLNAPSDELRSRLMPVNRVWPLARLRAALTGWPFFGGAHLCLEYVLIPGVNDRPEHARQLAAYVLGDAAPHAPGVERSAGPPLRGLVNVIPYNPRTNSAWGAPSEAVVERFAADLSAAGVYVKRRRTKGRDTMAACGQLGNPALHRARRVALTSGGT